MKEIPLTRGRVSIVDDEDFKWLNQWRWHCSFSGYAVRMSPRSEGKRYRIFMHRIIMDTPDGMDVDHINHNTVDNRRENLRNCTRIENGHNRKLNKDSTTGYKGVAKHGRWFRARIQVDGRLMHLGLYSTPEEAAHAYDEAAVKYFGEFCRVNFES